MVTQKLFVNENISTGAIIGYIPGLGRSRDWYTFDTDEDSDGIPSVIFERATERFVVVDADELDYEDLGDPILDFEFWFSEEGLQGTSYDYGYNSVRIYVQDLPGESFNGTNANDYLVDTDAGDTILRGYKGNDRLLGAEGSDTLTGGAR